MFINGYNYIVHGLWDIIILFTLMDGIINSQKQ